MRDSGLERHADSDGAHHVVVGWVAGRARVEVVVDQRCVRRPVARFGCKRQVVPRFQSGRGVGVAVLARRVEVT